jgi:predicted nucleic acid-binding protein
MNNLLLDTNILIYILQGHQGVRELVEESIWHISFISEMELLMKPNITLEESISIKALLAECHIIEMNQAIKEQAIQNNQDYRLKLADSIILASAQTFGIPFITADIEFRKVESPNQDILLFRP